MGRCIVIDVKYLSKFAVVVCNKIVVLVRSIGLLKLSLLLGLPKNGHIIDCYEHVFKYPFCWEVTSSICIILLIPLILRVNYIIVKVSSDYRISSEKGACKAVA